MGNTVREQIFELADAEYREFQTKLCPGIPNIIGVRVPALRKLAKQIAKGDWQTYMKEAQDEYYEEIMLQGMVLGYTKADIDYILSYVDAFVPKIDNWATCDVFCSGLKITNLHMEDVWKYLQKYLKSTEEFELRYAVVMILSFYIQEDYIDRIFEITDGIKHDGYYVKMAVAWLISICYIKFPEKTMQYLKDNSLDDFTYNKALQKIIESLRVDKETKNNLRSMKRK